MLFKDFIKRFKNDSILISPLVYVMKGNVILSTNKTTIVFDTSVNDFEIVCSDFTRKETSIDKDFVVTSKIASISSYLDNKNLSLKLMSEYLNDEIIDVTFTSFTDKKDIKFYKGIGTMNLICSSINDSYHIINLIVKNASVIPTGKLLPFN